MKKFAKKIIAMFTKEIMDKIKSDKFEMALAKKFAAADDEPLAIPPEPVANKIDEESAV